MTTTILSLFPPTTGLIANVWELLPTPAPIRTPFSLTAQELSAPTVIVAEPTRERNTVYGDPTAEDRPSLS